MITVVRIKAKPTAKAAHSHQVEALAGSGTEMKNEKRNTERLNVEEESFSKPVSFNIVIYEGLFFSSSDKSDIL